MKNTLLLCLIAVCFAKHLSSVKYINDPGDFISIETPNETKGKTSIVKIPLSYSHLQEIMGLNKAMNICQKGKGMKIEEISLDSTTVSLTVSRLEAGLEGIIEHFEKYFKKLDIFKVFNKVFETWFRYYQCGFIYPFRRNANSEGYSIYFTPEGEAVFLKSEMDKSVSDRAEMFKYSKVRITLAEAQRKQDVLSLKHSLHHFCRILKESIQKIFKASISINKDSPQNNLVNLFKEKSVQLTNQQHEALEALSRMDDISLPVSISPLEVLEHIRTLAGKEGIDTQSLRQVASDTTSPNSQQLAKEQKGDLEANTKCFSLNRREGVLSKSEGF